MAFPQTYNSKVELFENKLKGEKISTEFLNNIISEKSYKKGERIVNEERSGIFFSYLNKVFRYNFTSRIYTKQNGNDFDIVYEIEMYKVIQIIIAVIVLSAFFSFISVKYFLIFSGIFSLLFYYINLLMNVYSVEQIIKDAVGENHYTFSSAEVLTDEQIQWMKDKNRCSACGEYLSVTDVFCPECELRIKKGKPYKFYDSSKYNDRKVSYHYKKNS